MNSKRESNMFITQHSLLSSGSVTSSSDSQDPLSFPASPCMSCASRLKCLLEASDTGVDVFVRLDAEDEKKPKDSGVDDCEVLNAEDGYKGLDTKTHSVGMYCAMVCPLRLG